MSEPCFDIEAILDEMNYRLLKQYDDHKEWEEAKDVIENLDLLDLLHGVIKVADEFK